MTKTVKESSISQMVKSITTANGLTTMPKTFAAMPNEFKNHQSKNPDIIPLWDVFYTLFCTSLLPIHVWKR